MFFIVKAKVCVGREVCLLLNTVCNYTGLSYHSSFHSYKKLSGLLYFVLYTSDCYTIPIFDQVWRSLSVTFFVQNKPQSCSFHRKKYVLFYIMTVPCLHKLILLYIDVQISLFIQNRACGYISTVFWNTAKQLVYRLWFWMAKV